MRIWRCLSMAGIAALVLWNCPAWGDIVNGSFDNNDLQGYEVTVTAMDPSLVLVEPSDGRLHIRSSNTYTWDGMQWMMGDPYNAGVWVTQIVPAVSGYWAPAGTEAIEFDAEVTVTGVPSLPAGNMSAFAWFTVNYSGAVNYSDFLTDVNDTIRVEMPGLVPNETEGIEGIEFQVSVYSLLDTFPSNPGVNDSYTVTVDSYFDNFHFVPEVEPPTEMLIDIDIRPGTSPNTINLGSKGVIPVAILSSASFDAMDVDPCSVMLADAGVRIRGKGKSIFGTDDVNGDGLVDMILNIETEALELATDATEALLTGMTYDGLAFQGKDQVVITGPPPVAPEPSSIMLVILGGVAVLQQRRSRHNRN